MFNKTKRNTYKLLYFIQDFMEHFTFKDPYKDLLDL